MNSLRLITIACLVALLTLTGCDSAEERAEKHFQSALAYLAEGDTDRASVEFRNVFKLNGLHKEAREAYANMQDDLGNHGEAYSQFLRLVEQFPDHFEGQLKLAEMSLQSNNLKSAERHGRIAFELDSDNLRARAVVTFLDHEKAVKDGDGPALEAVLIRAEQLINSNPDLIHAHTTLIRDRLNRNDWPGAIKRIDQALKDTNEAEFLNSVRYITLVKIGNEDDIEAHLLNMVGQNPDDLTMLNGLVGWYISVEKFEEAEKYIRDLVKVSDEKEPVQERLVNFIRENRGNAAAIEELNRLIEESPESKSFFEAQRARINFTSGKPEEAMAVLKALIENEPASDIQDEFKVSLSKMYKLTDNPAGALSLVEEVLERQPNHLSAMLERAEWLIDSDNTRDAIVLLRSALGVSPNNPRVLTLMANAHERDGNKELMMEMLALAVRSSRAAPSESMRYARVLEGEDKPGAAEEVLSNALRLRPKNIELLTAIANIQIALKDWDGAADKISRINQLDDERSAGIVSDLTVKILDAQERKEDLDRYLNQVASQGQGVVQADLQIVQRHLDANDPDGALAHISKMEAKGENVTLWKFTRARILTSLREYDEAQSLYQDLLDKNDKAISVWVQLYELLLSAGPEGAATAKLEEGIAANPENGLLKLYMAGDLERVGDIDGAIAAYKELYERNSASVLIANNYAALVSMHRDDKESLEKAYKIARRFRAAASPAALDTYGWLAFRLGNVSEALPLLEKAQNGLPEEPTVAFHYGMALSGAKFNDRAIAMLEKAMTLADQDNPPVFIDQARLEIERLKGLKAAE